MFEELDRLGPLRVSRAGGGREAPRRITSGRYDAVTDLLDECGSASALAGVAARFGVSAEEIAWKADRAASFAQFRMAIGNRIRGICRRLERDRRSGRPMSLRNACRPVHPPKYAESGRTCPAEADASGGWGGEGG